MIPGTSQAKLSQPAMLPPGSTARLVDADGCHGVDCYECDCVVLVIVIVLTVVKVQLPSQSI